MATHFPIRALAWGLFFGFAVPASSQKKPQRQISVGTNVQISKALSKDPHFEVDAQAHPSDPNLLIACSMVSMPKMPRYRFSTAVYVSRDGGKNWNLTLGPDRISSSADATCGFGLDSLAYYAALGENTPGPNPGSRTSTVVYTSFDKGKTWNDPTALLFNDRELLSVDYNPKSPYRGRLYIIGHAGGLLQLRAKDGLNFTSTVESQGHEFSFTPGNHVILSDGTIVAVGTSFPKPGGFRRPGTPEPRGEIVRYVSHDGGETYDKGQRIDQYWLEGGFGYSLYYTTGFLPNAGVDVTGGPYNDRIYVVWVDDRSGKPQILLSRSDDKGTSFSSPVAISDELPPSATAAQHDILNPVIRVNNKGVVGLAWHDRRESKDGLSYHIRFKASYDGGETWTPTVRVSSQASHFTDLGSNIPLGWTPGYPGAMTVGLLAFAFTGGHYAGMSVDADGRFHPVWPDTRTGISQLWTAAVTTPGSAEKNGGGDLAQLEDYSRSVTVQILEPVYNRARGTITANARLRNDSKDTLRGPIKVRITKIESELATNVAILDADNGESGVGAVLDFSSLLPGNVLPPEGESRDRRVTFRISGLKPYRKGAEIRGHLFEARTQVLVTRK
jgi:hypothetical protein